MSKPVLGLGVVFVLLGLWLALFPDQFVSIVDWESRQGLYTAAGMRIVVYSTRLRSDEVESLDDPSVTGGDNWIEAVVPSLVSDRELPAGRRLVVGLPDARG